MLARYSIQRGRKLGDYPKAIREGTRQDTRKHTRHVLRPEADEVQRYLADPSAAAWKQFRDVYLDLLDARFTHDRAPFDAIADLARQGDVFLGCNCPTAANPDVKRCHTTLALRFMRERYRDLVVQLP